MHAVELKLVQDLEVFVLSVGPRVVLKIGPRVFVVSLSLYFPNFWSVFGVCLKTQIGSIGAKRVSQDGRDVNMRVFEKLYFNVFMLQKDTEK